MKFPINTLWAVRTAQAILVLIPLFVFAWLLNIELVPGGTFRVSRQPNEVSAFLDRLLPDARLLPVRRDEAGDWVQSMIGDPVFFFAHPHRGFDTIQARVWFKNDSAPILELGALAQEEGQVYDLHPLHNRLLDDLSWERITQDGLTLYQRVKTFETLLEFFDAPPDRSRVATYHASLASRFVLPDYRPSASVQTTHVSLRGFHELQTYVKEETLSFSFAYTDMNRSEGPDPVTLVVVDAQGTPVGSISAVDDGDRQESGVGSGVETIEIALADLPEGVYKILLQANTDIFFRSYTTPQQKVVFLNNLFFGDEIGYRERPNGVVFWTEAKQLGFQTRHVEGLQSVLVGSQSVVIEEPYKSFSHNVTETGIVRSFLPKGDVEIHAIGHFAFAASQYFNPDPVRLTAQTDLDAQEIDYVLTSYQPPICDGDWFVAEATFDAKQILLQDRSWKFVLSAPGIEQAKGQAHIGRIEMDWIRTPLWNAFGK